MNLTGSKQGDIETLMQMDDMTLSRICQVNRHFQSICGDDNFWFRRFYTLYPNITENGDLWLNFKKTARVDKYIDEYSQNRPNGYVMVPYTWREIYKYITEITQGEDHFPTTEDANRIVVLRSGAYSRLVFLEQLGVLPNVQGANKVALDGDEGILEWLHERGVDADDDTWDEIFYEDRGYQNKIAFYWETHPEARRERFGDDSNEDEDGKSEE
jgi:hypothetical protein